MSNLELGGDVVLHGRVGGRDFEQRYPVKLVASDARGNAFVERLYAGARILDLERDGTDAAKKEAVALSSRFSVASRYTSLLVLESEAMFRAFGLDNRRTATTFTGDEEAESSAADGLLDVGAEDDLLARDGKDTTSGMGMLGAGRGAGSASGGSLSSTDAFGAAEPAPSFDSAPSTSRAAPKPAARPTPTVAPPYDRPPTKKEREEVFVPQPRRRMIPMRKVWRRHGEIVTSRLTPRNASESAVGEAERELSRNENRRESLKKLYVLMLQSAAIERAGALSVRWSEKEPLDPEAITARADVLAASGDRAAAIRVLGSVIDVRPGRGSSFRAIVCPATVSTMSSSSRTL
jgi:hypothetical protein